MKTGTPLKAARTGEIRLRRAGAFGRQVTFRLYERARGVHTRHQTDVRQFCYAAHEDDVGGFHVAMDQPVPVQMRQRASERQGDGKALVGGQCAKPAEIVAECSRKVISNLGVRHLHNVIKVGIDCASKKA